MKKIIVLIILFCNAISAYSQTDSLLIKEYEKKILENSKLKDDLKIEKQNSSTLSAAYNKDTLALKKQIKSLSNEVSSEQQKVSDLNKNKIKEERDNLLKKVKNLNDESLRLNQIITDKDNQIVKERANAITTADNAKNDGKAETLAKIINPYQTLAFDELIKSSTKKSVIRDMQLVGNNLEVKPVLNDLQIYFNAQELLSEKYDETQIKNTQSKLDPIKHPSKLLDELKENVEFYKDFNNALKETISKLIDLDKHKSATGDAEIQKLKFNDIVTILSDYMYNYYDYAKYPYLFDTLLEIIKRKKLNADTSITDLFQKL